MLDVLALSFDYQEKPLLAKVQFSLPAGQLLHLLGINGSGKTTLLKLLAGLLQAREGEIRYKGEVINKNLGAYQRKLCYLGHKPGISPLLTVRENCYFDMHWGRRCVTFESLLAAFGLEALSEVPAYLLSAGQKRRLSLLRLAMSDASLWLLDEPLVALDTQAIQTLIAILENHLEQGGQVILTSHQNLPLQHSCLEYSL